MFLLLDNYDSFTYNLRHYLGELGAEVEVRRNDAISADEALALGAEGIVISPGPRDPDRAGTCLGVGERGAGRPARGGRAGSEAPRPQASISSSAAGRPRMFGAVWPTEPCAAAPPKGDSAATWSLIRRSPP